MTPETPPLTLDPQVGALKMVSSEAIRLLLWILGFMSFGFATGEFEVTRDRYSTLAACLFTLG